MPVVTTKYPNQTEEERQPQQAAVPSSPNLPYAQEGQLLNVVKPPRPAAPTAAATGGNTVLATAQQSAVNAQNQPNQTMGLVQQGVQKILQNPLGYDPKKYQQNQLEQYDRNRASAMAGYQQANADVMNTGINREKAYNYAMQGAQGRSDLENQVAMEQATKEREAMLAALGAGGEAVRTQSGLDEAAFNRLIAARGAGEGERGQMAEQTFSDYLNTKGYNQDIQKMAIVNGYDLNKLDKTFGYDIAKMTTQSNLDNESKTALMNLQDKIDTGQINLKQSYDSVQKELDRQHDIAIQKGDQEGAKAIEELRGKIADQAAEKNRIWQSSERAATQTWQTGERIGAQDHDSAMTYFKEAAEDARQRNDIDAQKTIEDMKEKFQFAYQTQEMGHDEKMAFIEGQIAEAKANGDFGREKNLIAFKTTQNIETMLKQAEIDSDAMRLQGDIEGALQTQKGAQETARIMLQGDIEKDIKAGDYAAAEAAQTSGFVFQAQENAKDRVQRNYEITLQQRGINIGILKDAVDSGRISPETYFAQLQKIGKDLGISVEPPDTMAVEKEAIKDFNSAKIQWGASHPDMLKDKAKPELGLNDAGMVAFNQFYNDTLYNDQEFGSSQFKPAYWDNAVSTTNANAFKTNPPAVGSFIKMKDGVTYKIESDVTPNQSQNGRLEFTATNMQTGQIVTIGAGEYKATQTAAAPKVGGIGYSSGIVGGGFSF